MRLSTAPDRDEANGVAVIHAALDAGVTLLDTADAYCRDDSERGHNERLVAAALANWTGDSSTVQIATKGGMTRPDGRWEPDARAKQLAARCEDSRRALGVDRIHLYQLHSPDPRTPLSTSVRALAALQRDGLIDRIGLSNVTVGQIAEARRIAEIASVQIELSVWHDEHLLSGVVDYCIAERIQLVAYRPLGGPSRRRQTAADPTLSAIAARHGATPFEIALAWLLQLSELVVPIPGATRVDTARSIARASEIALLDEDRDELDRRFAAGRVRASVQMHVPDRPLRTDGEVVLIMGLPAAGKSTVAEGLAASGYLRLNRDTTAGSLKGLLPPLDAALASGVSRVVLDNTYVSRQSRAAVIRSASARGFPVRCIWMDTPIEEAQTNAVWRIVSKYGTLPDEAGLERLRKGDPAAFLPGVQFRYLRDLEPPDAAEGFSSIDVIPFERQVAPSCTNRAILVWCDGVVLHSRSGRRTPVSVDDVDVALDRAEVLGRYRDDGWRLLGLSWQPAIAEGTQTADGARAIFARMNERLDLGLEVEFCPHAAGPPRCWCRKPLPGLGVVFVHRHALDPAQCIYVGAGPQDPGFARRLGFRYRDAADFFGSAAGMLAKM